jgi:hypothetical protein
LDATITLYTYNEQAEEVRNIKKRRKKNGHTMTV